MSTRDRLRKAIETRTNVRVSKNLYTHGEGTPEFLVISYNVVIARLHDAIMDWEVSERWSSVTSQRHKAEVCKVLRSAGMRYTKTWEFSWTPKTKLPIGVRMPLRTLEEQRTFEEHREALAALPD